MVMKSDYSIEIKEKSLLFMNVSIDWCNVLKGIAKLANSAIFLNPAPLLSVAADLFGIAKLENNLGHYAAKTLFAAYINCMHSAFEGAGVNLPSIHLKQSKDFKILDFEINDLGKRYLEDTTFFKTLTKNLKEYLYDENILGPSNIAQIRAIERCMNDNFSRHLRSLITAHGNKFKEFKDYYLDLTANQETWDKEDEIKVYRKKMENQFASKTINQGLSLDKIYIDPKCRAEIRLSESNILEIDDQQSLLKLVVQLLPMDRPIVIQGEPGHGKTSFSKKLAYELAAQCHNNEWFPVLSDFKSIIPEKDLSGLDISANLFLDANFIRKKRVLLILDGMDEILGGSTPVENYTRFLGRIFDLMKACRESGIGGNVVITTRNKFLEAQPDCIPLKTQYHLLTIKDFDNDLIKEWLKKFHSFCPEPRITQETFKKYKLITDNDIGIIGLPVLLAMVTEMLSNVSSKDLFQNQSEIWRKFDIYNKIVEGTFKREKEKQEGGVPRKIPWKTGYDFCLFLEGISGILFMERETTLDIRTIKDRWKNDKELLKIDDPNNWNEENVKVCLFFYFKSRNNSSIDNTQVEFVHKSFLDFFIAKRILRFLEKIVEQTQNKNEPDDDTAFNWMKIAGWQPLDSATLSFIEDNLQSWVLKDNNKYKPMQEHLDKVFNEMRTHHYIGNPKLTQYLGKKFYECSVHALASLFKVTQTIHNILFPSQEIIYWDDNEPNGFTSFYFYLNSIKPTYFLENNFSFKKVSFYGQDMSGLDLTRRYHVKHNPRLITFSGLTSLNMDYANLKESNLAFSNLSFVSLCEANLTGANLTGANLIDANLNGANLNGANLSRANLSYANLSRADMRRADLYRADLRGAFLTKTDLRGTGLGETYMTVASIKEAKRF